MAGPNFKVPATEVDGAGQPWPGEIQLSGSNVLFTPPAGFTAENVQAAIEQVTKVLVVKSVSSTANFSVDQTQTTFLADPNISLTPGAGFWVLFFSSACETSGVNVEAYVELFINGVAVAETLREVRTSTAILGLLTLSTASVAAPVCIIVPRSLAANDVLTIRIRVASGAGSIILGPRTLLAVQAGLT